MNSFIGTGVVTNLENVSRNSIICHQFNLKIYNKEDKNSAVLPVIMYSTNIGLYENEKILISGSLKVNSQNGAPYLELESSEAMEITEIIR
jgi:hypothetical protein